MYFDSAASTPIHPEVLAAMREVEHLYANPYSKHVDGFKAFKILQQSLNTISQVLGVSPDQLVITHGGTDGNRKVIYELQKRFGHQSIFCGNTEHSSVIDEFEEEQIFDVETHCNASDHETLRATSLPQNAKALCLMYANNETGAIYNASRLRKQFEGALILQDWVQGLGKQISFNPDNCDFATFSAHKIHGPKGVGILYIKNPEHFAKLSKDSHTKDPMAVAGMAKAFELSQQINVEQIKAWTEKIETFLLKTFPNCIIHDQGQERVPGIINVAFKGVRGSELMSKLSHEEGVCVSTGSACQSDMMSPTHVIKAIQSNPDYQYPIRISLHQFLTDEDVEDLCEILKEYI